MRWASPAVRAAAVTSGLALAAQLVSVVVQLAFAALFGSSGETDGYFAALALPAFVVALFTASVPVVLVPILVEQRTIAGREASDAAGGMLVTLTTAVVGALVVGAVVASDEVLAATAPGLSPSARISAASVAPILWPSTIALTLAALLAAGCQAESRFTWPAAAPLVGATTNVLLLLVLGPVLGTTGAAVAWTASAVVQVLVLVPVIGRRWRPRLALDPATREVIGSAWPLLGSAAFAQVNIVWERWLGSLLPVGQLSQLTYASRMVASVGTLVTTGPAVVLLPRLSEIAASDRARLGSAIGRGLRSLWLVAAPLGTLTFVLADPLVETLFQRGAFTRDDAAAVATMLRLYDAGLVFGILSVVTSRGLFAIRRSRVVAAMGTVEGLAYMGYTAWLSSVLGAAGIALGFVAFYGISLVWQLAYLRRMTGSFGPISPLAAAGAAAVVAALVASGVTLVTRGPFLSLALASGAGLAAYAAALAVWRGTTIRRSSQPSA